MRFAIWDENQNVDSFGSFIGKLDVIYSKISSSFELKEIANLELLNSSIGDCFCDELRFLVEHVLELHVILGFLDSDQMVVLHQFNIDQSPFLGKPGELLRFLVILVIRKIFCNQSESSRILFDGYDPHVAPLHERHFLTHLHASSILILEKECLTSEKRSFAKLRILLVRWY